MKEEMVKKYLIFMEGSNVRVYGTKLIRKLNNQSVIYNGDEADENIVAVVPDGFIIVAGNL